MTALLGTNVSARIVPFADTDIFASHVSTYGQGGWHEVADTTARDAIPAARLLTGMIAWATGTGIGYIYGASSWGTWQISNTNLANSSVTISGHSLSLGGSLSLAAGDVSGLAAIATSGSASDLGTGTIPNARISALPNANLANSAITIAGHSVALGGSQTITIGDLSTIAANSFVGNNTGSSAAPLALTAAQAKTVLAIAAADVSGLATVATSGSATDLGTGTIPNARISALPNANLANSAVTINGHSVSLGGTLTLSPSDIGTFGTIASQNANAIAITGGAINGTTIGGTTAAAGAFTTITASAAVTLSPANATVSITPSGTGTVTVNPATTGTIDNANIGQSSSGLGTFSELAVNAAVDATNKLSVASASSLFNNIGADCRIIINKAATGNTASTLYQNAFSGRAEVGLCGDDSFHFKVSADGSAWHDALDLAAATGNATFNFPVAFPNGSGSAPGIAFASCGLFQADTGVLGLSFNSAEGMRLSANGIAIGTGADPVLGLPLQINVAGGGNCQPTISCEAALGYIAAQYASTTNQNASNSFQKAFGTIAAPARVQGTFAAPTTLGSFRFQGWGDTGFKNAVILQSFCVEQTAASHTVTVSIASPAIISWTGHGLANDSTFTLSTTGALPTGLATATTYFVVNKTTNNFQAAATQGGTAINTSGTQSGTHTASAVNAPSDTKMAGKFAINIAKQGGVAAFSSSTQALSLDWTAGMCLFGTATTIDATGIYYPPSFTVAGLPAATATGIIQVSNDGGGTTLAYSDGSVWRRVSDRQQVSTGNVAGGVFAILGVNATPDTTNRLSVASASVLFNNIGSDFRLTMNKAASGNTASTLYQDAFSGRAEVGLCGDDNFHFKVSPDGSSWTDALILNKTTGQASFAYPLQPKVYTVSALPSAATAGAGSRAHVSDATATTFASAVAGGGSNSVPVYSDGTTWRIG